MFPAGHGHIARAADIAARSLKEWGGPVRMSLVGEDLVVEDRSVLELGDGLPTLAALLQKNGWEGVRISPSCAPSDLLEWIVRSQSGGDGPYVGAV
jgi:hypothetical protein